jgi:hypothetical protein
LKWGLINYLPRLASNQDPPNLGLPSIYNYKDEPLAPSNLFYFLKLFSDFRMSNKNNNRRINTGSLTVTDASCILQWNILKQGKLDVELMGAPVLVLHFIL